MTVALGSHCSRGNLFDNIFFTSMATDESLISTGLYNGVAAK